MTVVTLAMTVVTLAMTGRGRPACGFARLP
jgi:hypothetical protein